MAKLTNCRDVPFEICFKYPLERGYTFENLSQRNLKDFQRFLDKVSIMTVDQVDHSFARKPDQNDSFQGNQVYHYEVSKGFRIHVVNEAGYYKVIRLDPNHRFHA